MLCLFFRQFDRIIDDDPKEPWSKRTLIIELMDMFHNFYKRSLHNIFCQHTIVDN